MLLLPTTVITPATAVIFTVQPVPSPLAGVTATPAAVVYPVPPFIIVLAVTVPCTPVTPDNIHVIFAIGAGPPT